MLYAVARQKSMLVMRWRNANDGRAQWLHYSVIGGEVLFCCHQNEQWSWVGRLPRDISAEQL